MALPKEEDIANVNIVSADTPNVLTDSIYNMTPNVEKLSEESTGKEDDSNKATLASTVSSSAVTDMSDPYAEQMRNLTSDNAYTLTPFQDTIPTNVASADSSYYSIGANLNSKKNFGSQFDNVNEDNVNVFYTTAQNIGSDFMSAGTSLKQGLQETGMAPLFSAIIGNPAMAVLGGAAQFIGLGLKQEKDKNNFLKAFGEQGFSQELLNTSFPYAGKNNKTGAQFLQHILYNSNNPGYALKYNAYGGKKGFNGNHVDALAKFINEGVDNNIFPISNILNMSANRYNTQGGSNAYMTTTAAQKALEGKGWQVKGRVAIAPDGTQYLDGKIWGGKDLSNVIKKKYGFVNTALPVVTETPAVGNTTSSDINNQSSSNYYQQNFSEKDSSQDSGGSYGGGEPSGGYSSSSQQDSNTGYSANQGGGAGYVGSVVSGGETIQSPSSPPSYSYSDTSSTGAKDGFTYGLQQGGSVGNPMGQQQGFVQDAGNLEMVNEPNKDMSGVADDVPRQLNDGDFVINAPAMDMAGRGDIERMVTKAVIELQRKGVKLDFGQAAEDVDSTVQALVSNKEMIIPKIIAEQIGYDRLTKINNRGKERVDELAKEQEQIQQNPTQPNPQGMMAIGGQVSLDENKNQPIAVPQESFAGQSSVGSKLLSPMSPEAQDDEKELTNRSQSFEGFMKPVKLKKGDKIKPKPKPVEMFIDKMSDEETLANVIFSEAEGESTDGKRAVGDVIFNRLKNPSAYNLNRGYGNSNLKKLITSPEQFDGVKTFKFFKPNKNSPQYKESLEIAKDLLNNKNRIDTTNGATFFYRTGTEKPTSINKLQQGIVIGNHTFLNENSPSSMLNNKNTENSGVTLSPSLSNQQKLRNDVIENMRSRGMMANN